MKKFLLIPFLFFVFAATGQNDSAQALEKDSLYYKTSMLTIKPKLFLNKKIIRPSHEINVFNEVPGSIRYYKKYKNRFTIGLVSASVTSLTVIMVGLPKKQGTKNILIFSAIGLFINSEFFLISGLKNLRKAVKTRNQAVLHF